MTSKINPKIRAFKWTIAIALFLAYSIISINKSWNDDFRAYYQAGKYILSDANIYDQNIVEGGFLYSPLFALLMVPLSILPQHVAAAIWYLANLTSLFFLIAIALYLNENSTQPISSWLKAKLNMTNVDKTLKVTFVLVLIFSARFWLNSIEHGQINLQLWALVLIAIYFQNKGLVVIGSALLSLAIVTKILPALFLFYFLIRKQYGFVLLSVLFSLFFLTVPAGILGWQNNIDLITAWYNKALSPGLTQGAIGVGDSNQSLPAMLIRFLSCTPANEETGATVNFLSLPPQAIGLLTKLSSLLLLAIITVALLFRKQRTTLQENLVLSIVFLSAALMPALAWKAYYVASIMGYTTVVYYLVKMRNGKLYRSIGTLIVLSFILHTLTSDGIWGWRTAHILQSYSCVTFSMLSLYAALILILLKQRTETKENS